jgi:hypothetical protein
MNKVVKDLGNALTQISTQQNGNGNGNGNGRKRRRNRKRNRNRNKGGQVVRARNSNNPLTTQGVRGPVGQSLTSAQFTATSPLNLFTTTPGSSPGGIRVKGRELIGAVEKTSNNNTWQLCEIISPLPGVVVGLNPRFFPRLSSYTALYDLYVFHSATFILQSSSPTTAGGSWMMCLDYDVKDDPPASTMQMLRNVSSSIANVYSDQSCVTVKSLARLPKFFTEENNSSGTDVAQEIQAQLFVACEGFAGAENTPLGYVICEYDIEFFSPQ